MKLEYFLGGVHYKDAAQVPQLTQDNYFKLEANIYDDDHNYMGHIYPQFLAMPTAEQLVSSNPEEVEKGVEVYLYSVYSHCQEIASALGDYTLPF